MLKSFARWAGGVSVISVLAFAPLDSRADAPLENATWIEAIQVTSSAGSTSTLGVNDAAPEPITDSLTGDDYSLNGAVAFPVAGAPNTAVTLSARHGSGLTQIGALSGCRIDFQFRVVESATPPVPVTLVPVHIHAEGTADASGDPTIRAAAFSQFTLIGAGALLIFWGVDADNVSGGPPPSDSFANDDQLDLARGVVIAGELFVDASIGTESPAEDAAVQAGATADPVIEIADVTIPGTAASFRDYFTVEFSPGYFALGPTPVERTTWGAIKARFR